VFRVGPKLGNEDGVEETNVRKTRRNLSEGSRAADRRKSENERNQSELWGLPGVIVLTGTRGGKGGRESTW